MKNSIYIVFFIGCSVTYAQPPVERNNPVTNSVEAESSIKETEKKETAVPQTTSAQTINDFFDLYNQASSLPGQKNPTAHQQRRMNEFVKQSQRENTNSFEYNLSVFMAGNYDISKKEFLDNAKLLQPKNQQVLLQSVGTNFILADEKTLISDLKELKKQKKWTTDDFLYAKDVLTSISANGILITHGINDSYPVLYFQLIENYRKDVKIIPMHLLQSREYKKQLLKYQLFIPASNTINIQYIQEFCQLNEESGLYLALTIPQTYFSPIEQYLYPLGLTFHYSKSIIKNSSLNEQLWKNELDKSVIHKSNEVTGKQLSANYLPLLLNLYSYYEADNNVKQLTEIKNTIRQIGYNIENKNLIKELGLSE